MNPFDHSSETGPFDIIGDVHGCFEELQDLLNALGYGRNGNEQGRKLVFVGDLINRGPRVLDVLKFVMGKISTGGALAVIGNHEDRLIRRLKEQKRQPDWLLREDRNFRLSLQSFLEGLPSYLVLDRGKLVVAHAGIQEEMIGKENDRVREFAMYGQPTGRFDEYGYPIRYNWAAEYNGPAIIVYGHTPVGIPKWVNHTINIDTGCVYGGSLTALRYPEQKLISMPARKVHYARRKPLR